MSQVGIGQHILRRFDRELEDVRSHVLDMGGLVEGQLRDAISAIVAGDSALAEEVVRNDYKVNAMEVSIDEECNRILARRQPAASDLRLVIAVIKTITDLERMGDEAQRVGRIARELAEFESPTNNYRELQNLGNHVRQMLHEALDAFARTDVEAGFKVVREDVNVDEEYESIMRQQLTFMMEDPRRIPRTINVMWAARALERIGDRACNIGEYVIYMVKGRDVRHTTLEQVEQEIRETR